MRDKVDTSGSSNIRKIFEHGTIMGIVVSHNQITISIGNIRARLAVNISFPECDFIRVLSLFMAHRKIGAHTMYPNSDYATMSLSRALTILVLPIAVSM